MNISPILNFNYSINQKQTNTPQFKLQQLKNDTVSFSGKKTVELHPNIEEAKNLGILLYDKSLKDPNYNPVEIIKKQASDVEVLPIKELRKIIPDYNNYSAFFNIHINKNLNAENQTIYVNTDSPNKDKAQAIIKAMDIAHEYTHYLQNKNGDEIEFIKKFNKDYNYLGTIIALAPEVFKIFDTRLQADMLLLIFNNAQDRENNRKYGRVLPNKRNITKEDLLKLNGFKNEAEFKKLIDSIFENNFNALIQALLSPQTNLVDPMIKEEIHRLVKANEIEYFKKDLKKYCAHTAQNEFQAYSTESAIAKEILKTRQTINLDAFCIYYKMLEDAFNS